MAALISTSLVFLSCYQSVESLYNVRQKPTILHLDVEPHTLGTTWSSDKPGVSNQYLDFIDNVKTELSTQSSPLEPRMVIPWHYNEVTLTRTGTSTTKKLSEFVLDSVDYVSIMNYRNVQSQFDSFSDDELAYADTLSNKKIVIAAETKCGEGTWVTFCEHDSTTLENVLTNTLTSFQGYTSFENFAIHYYTSYDNLAPSYTISSSTCNSNYRGLYVWETAMVTTPVVSDQEDLFDFCNDHCIDTVYLAIYPMLSNNKQQELADFIDLAFDYDIKVELTTGNPDWALSTTWNWVKTNVINKVIQFEKDLDLYTDSPTQSPV